MNPSLEWLYASAVSSLDKGMPGGIETMRLDQIGLQGWNLLAGDLSFPAAVLKRSALDANRAWMRAFVAGTGVMLAPHGKTTMAPQLFAAQMDDGAWGLTCATANHLEVYRKAGVRRVLFANQLVGAANLRMALAHLRDPDFELYVLADSLEHVEMLAEAMAAAELGRPLEVLLEAGAAGARTGVRSMNEGLIVARAIAAAPLLRLAGVETYEGVLPARGDAGKEASAVVDMLAFACDLARTCASEGLFNTTGPVIISAGGTDYFDLGVKAFGALDLGRPHHVIIRSGCYITNDSLHYARAFQRLIARDADAATLPGGLQPALEVWGVVQSKPEPGKILCTVGKRDISYDWDLPKPSSWFRPGVHTAPEPLSDHLVSALNDQHAHVATPAGSPLQVGDLVSFGVSHPCTTFDKWRIIPVVDDTYQVVDAIRTCF